MSRLAGAEPLSSIRRATREASHRSRVFRFEERATSLVEFAIVAGLLFLLVFGIVDFGRVYLLYNNLTNAAREGARLAAVLSKSTADTVLVRQSVRAKIAGTAAQQDLGTVSVTYHGTSPNETVRVQIQNYPFTPATFLAMSEKQLTVTAEFRYEHQ